MKKVIITQHGNWFSFSPSGHAFYNKNDEIKVNGSPGLCLALKNNHCYCVEVRGYNLNGHLWKPNEINAIVTQL